jgi:hypothetical protein
MPFDQSTITAVRAARHDASLFVSWESTAPEGTAFQVYVARRLVAHGPGRSALLPWPPTAVAIDVGAVDPGEELADLSGTLPAPAGTGDRIRLTWLGGSYLDPTIRGYRIYGEATAGGGINYTAPVGTVAAYGAGLATDGFGLGGFGSGGFGSGAASYSWTSGPLGSGTWHFAILPYDDAGNEGTAVVVSATVSAPPAPPAADANGKRLTYVYNSVSRIVTLSWLPSPG